MLPGWSAADIAGKPAFVFAPVNPRFALLFLHPVGGESISESAAYTAELARYGVACCEPVGARGWWADRGCAEFDPVLTPEQHLLTNVLPWMREHMPGSLAVAGISMGGQGAVRLGLKYPERFPVVASVAGAFDYHELYGRGTPLDDMYRSREACRQDTAVLHVHPTRFPPHVWFACDPADADWFRGNDRLHEKLSAVGIPHTADLTTSAGGHSWAYFDRIAGPLFAFLAEAVAKQVRRLL
jgi:pimeloyl-ACP methyl ester carboxylesterase